MHDKVGLALTREVSLKVNWLECGQKLSKAINEGFKAFSGDLPSGLEAGFALAEAAKAIKKGIPLGNKALELILLCFAWAFDSLRAARCINEPEAKALAKAAIDNLKNRVDAGELEIPYDFFQQPSQAKPYRLLRDEFLRSRQTYRQSEREDEAELSARFDTAFRSAVWKLWTDRMPALQELAHALSSPAAEMADFDRQWRAYRESLIHEFHVAPVFGQELTRVSLAQLYVPLRCFWRDIQELQERAPGYSEESGLSRRQIYHVRLLESELRAWLDNGASDDWLRLVGGGPGSGKSTSAKAFAASIAMREDLRPIFIPLQRLKVGERLREAVNAYFRDRSGCPFQAGPLERKNVESGPRLVLIFDGLDEIARPGSMADEIARDMMDWVRDLYEEIKGETNHLHRILVTGRMPSFQAARQRVNRWGKEALEVLDLLPIESTPMVAVLGEKELLEFDARPSWWDRYASALGRSAELPAGLTDSRLQCLTAEPLLCYLLALSGYLEENSQEAAENRNRVYARLMEDVWRRAWGGGRAGKGKSLSKEHFDRLFETMALAAWHGGDERVATHERFEHALKVTRAHDAWEEFAMQEGDNVSNLAVNFYLKRAEKDAKGFEFTHKSFGEYLAARALLQTAIATAEVSERHVEYALIEWLDAVDDGELSHELLTFLRDEARLLPTNMVKSKLRLLEKVTSKVISQGFPAQKLTCETWRRAEERQRKAETMLIVLMHCLSHALALTNEADAVIHIDWHGDKF